MHSNSFTPFSPIGNQYQDFTAHFDDYHQSSDSEHKDKDSRDPSPELDIESRKRLKVLNRMIPAFMIKKLANGGGSSQQARNKRDRSVTSSESDGDTSKPLPGQSRTRIAINPKDTHEIKGDTESSDDDRSSAADSEIDHISARKPFDADVVSLKGSKRDKVILDLTDSSSDSSDDGVDDDQIRAYLGDELEKPVRRGRVREESLIDWMLASTRTIGVHKKPRVKNSSGSRRGTISSKFDVTTRESRKMGRGRQTILNFEPQRSSSGRRRGEGRSAPLSSRQPASDTDVAHPSDRHEPVNPYVQEKSRKQKQKDRLALAKRNGIYTFASENEYVVTGRRETAMVTVDLEDEGFHRALAPLSQDWARAFKPPPIKTNARPPLSRQPPPDTPGGHDLQEDVVVHPLKTFCDRRDIRGDFDIPVLPSGHTSPLHHYIRKGQLHDLITTLSSTTVPLMPATFTLRGVTLDPSMGIVAFSKSLDQIFEDISHLATRLPGLDVAEEDQEWRGLFRITSQMTSWFRVAADEAEFSRLRSGIQRHVLEAISRIQEQGLDGTSIETSTFATCWFTVELSARAGILFSTAAPNPLRASVSMTVQILLKFGLVETMTSIRDGTNPDASSSAHGSAELWICLFHLLDTYNDPTKKPHPLWTVVTEALETTDVSKTPLETSESIWRAVFSLCALTQFSVHGMTTGTSRLPACWELVVLALKKIRLAADPIADRALSSASLDKRDEYIGLVTLRCFHLWNRWHWQLEDASILFNQLVEIFRSRKFASLRHEQPDYPAFVLLNDWSILSNYGHGDTAFVLFLKLLVQAASSGGADNANSNRTLLPRVKKLLSLAIPVGSLPFSKNKPTVVQDLSMLCNRLSAVAIGIYLDPSHHMSRISHARTYVDISDADETTRLAVIRGLMNLAILLKNNKIPLDGIIIWVEDIANVLTNEYKNLNMPKSEAVDQDQLSIIRGRLFLSVQVLIGAVRQIIDAHKLASEYPEPALLGMFFFWPVYYFSDF